ncbi:hypothetical protein [Acetobacterium bakii]|nr:hypothetical protein [Acetobacterium bakii]
MSENMTEMELIIERMKNEILTFIPNEQGKEAMAKMVIFLMIIA